VSSSPKTPGEGHAEPAGNPDLTSTIHLSSLRSVRNQRNIEEIFRTLSGEEREIVAQLPKNSAMLLVLAGPNKGARFLINGDSTSIGRDPQSEIFLDDVTVSRKHAEVVKDGDNYVIVDLGSLNGTYLNSQPSNRERLVVGDEVQIGKYRLTYFSGKGNS
jgi:FHA domain